MVYTYPDYFETFQCIAGKCPDTCCSSWQIVIDEQSLENYINYKGEYETALHKNVNWKAGVFRHKKGKCAFLREDLLCDMYLNMGKESLCTTCREYPRHTEEFENVREISLSLSCPEVCRMLMEREKPVSFYSKEDEEEEFFDEFDSFLYTNLNDIRETIIKTIQNRTEPLQERLKRVLQIGASAQRHYDEGNLIDWQALEDADNIPDRNEFRLFRTQFGFLLVELELLYPDWELVLAESGVLLFEQGEVSFMKQKESFLSWWKESDLTAFPIIVEQILVYFIMTYLPGAVYDENIVGKVDAAVGHICEIFLLLMARWIKNGQTLEQADLVELVYRYSREIEHSDENLETVELLNWFDRDETGEA